MTYPNKLKKLLSPTKKMLLHFISKHLIFNTYPILLADAHKKNPNGNN